MKNKKALIAIGSSILIAGAIIAWLMFGGSAPANVDLGNGVNAQLNASLKNRAVLKDIKGKIYRNDGSYLDVTAESGSTVIGENNFALEGKVQAVLSSGGKLLADKVAWQQDKEEITASGNVKMYKDEWFASADKAVTTSAFKKLKLTGNARVEKGGDMNDK